MGGRLVVGHASLGGVHAAMADTEPIARLQASLDRLNAVIGDRLVPLLESLASVVERLELVSGGGSASVDARGEAVAAIHEALRERAWARLAERVEALLRDYPDHPETVAVVDLSRRRREEAAVSLQEQLAASRETNDTETVLALRDELIWLLDPASRQELDQELVGWLMRLIQRRMRTGTVAVDVAALAAEVASRFGGFREGASVRASLPTLRRSAGLCPRCAEPYDGLENACPRCLPGGTAVVVIPVLPSEAAESAGDSPPAP